MHAIRHMYTRTHPRLHLPGELVDDDRQKASYDIDSGGYSMMLSNASTIPMSIIERMLIIIYKPCKLGLLIEGGIIIKMFCIKLIRDKCYIIIGETIHYFLS